MSSRLMFDMSDADLAFANDLTDDSLRKAVAKLPDAVARQLLVAAASHHMDICKMVVKASQQTHFEIDPPRREDSNGSNGKHFSISDEKLDVNWFQGEAQRAVTLASPAARKEKMDKLLDEIQVLVDLHQGYVALKAIFAVLPVLVKADTLPVEVWREICSFDGAMIRLSHLLSTALHGTTSERCREFIPHMSQLCDSLEEHGVTVFTAPYTALKRKAFYSNPGSKTEYA